jgi:hypothetical protein
MDGQETPVLLQTNVRKHTKEYFINTPLLSNESSLARVQEPGRI